MVDARTQRTRQTLAQAITELGATIRLEEMTVEDVVRASGLSKSTVYRHAKSPAAFMVDRLRVVLSTGTVTAMTTRSIGSSGRVQEDLHRQALTLLWTEVSDHWGLYKLSASKPDSVIMQLFLQTQLSAVAAYLRDNLEVIDLPRTLVNADPNWAAEVLAQQYCHSVAGMMRGILSLDEPLGLEDFISLARDLMPRWQRSMLGLD